jgi:hypothetical protein
VETWQEAMARQEGVVARGQCVDAGMSSRQWDWRISSGRWQRLAQGVVVSHTGPPTERQLAWAACLHAGGEAALSGDAGLRARGFRGDLGTAFDVCVPRARHVVGTAVATRTVTIRRTDVPSERLVAVQGLPVVDPHLATLHAAAWAADDRAAEWRVAAAVQQRLTAVPLLRTALRAVPKLPRRALLRQVLDDVELGAHAGSELAFLRFCRKHGVPLPDELQLRVRAGTTRHYLDARYTRQRVTVELDGAHHREAAQWEADLLRTLTVAATLPGERVVRLTPGLLRHEPAKVAELLRRLLA